MQNVVDSVSSIDLDFVKSNFPGLNRGWILFDNAGGSQTAQSAIDHVTQFLTEFNVQTGASYHTSRAAADAVKQGRLAAQILTNAAHPEEVIFGPSTTQLLRTLALSMRHQFAEGDEVIVSVADHEANIGPWNILRDQGVVVRFWPLDAESQTLRLDELEPLMTERTRLVCVHHVSNILGQINPIADFATFVHERGARICVDGVAYAPHRAMDVQSWDVDYYVFSLYKCYGPHIGLLYGKRDLLLDLRGQNHSLYTEDQIPIKMEPGNPCYELAYANVGVVDYLCGLAERHNCTGNKRELIESAFKVITRQENDLTDQILHYLRRRDDCQIVGTCENSSSGRVPTVAFKLEGQHSGDIVQALDASKIGARFGSFHSQRLLDFLSLSDQGGVVRVSMLHYNDSAEVDLLCSTLSDLFPMLDLA